MAQSTIDALPPFPSDLHTAPIAQISSRKLLDGDKEEGQRVLEACQTFGFFYLDLRDSEDGQRLIDEAEGCLELAKKSFASRKPEEHNQWHLQKGVSMFGYKAAGTVKKTDKEARPDTTEFWNISKDHMNGFAESREYPPEIEEAKPLLKNFTRDGHECGMIVLRTLARAMNLPTEIFVDLNTFSKPAGDHCRLTHKFPHATDKNAIGLPSHTDFGTVTILFNWLGGLQIQSRHPDRLGEWEWVKPEAGKAIINLGDAMVKFTNGALKSAKHRVVPRHVHQSQ